MKHWIVDIENMLLPNWREAMPRAEVVRRDQLTGLPGNVQGILWLRLRVGEVPAEIMQQATAGSSLHVVLLCDEPNETIVIQALTAGAAGCCNTHAAPEVLRQVAIVVGNGGLWIGHSLLLQMVGATSRALTKARVEVPKNEWASILSERETQVALLVAGGSSNKEVAEKLSISERTVKAHLTSIFEKLGLRDRLQLAVRVNGLSI